MRNRYLLSCLCVESVIPASESVSQSFMPQFIPQSIHRGWLIPLQEIKSHFQEEIRSIYLFVGIHIRYKDTETEESL